MKTLVIWLLVVFALSLYPFKIESGLIPYGDKVVHYIIYAITAMLFYTVLMEGRRPRLRGLEMPLAVLLTVGYGLLMEVAQGMVETRSFSIWDAVANALGAVSGALFILYTRRRRKVG